MADLVTVSAQLVEVATVVNEAIETIEKFRPRLQSILDGLNTLKSKIDKMEHCTDLTNRPKEELRRMYESVRACQPLVEKCKSITSTKRQFVERCQCWKELRDLDNQIAAYCATSLLTIFATDIKELAKATIAEMKDDYETRDGNGMPLHQATSLFQSIIDKTAKLAGSAASYDYDVILSFRGKDTRESFTGTLYYVLCEVYKVKTFIDFKLKKGCKIEDILKIIEKTKISIVVFSENFAESEWCLNELVKIFKEKDRRQHQVVPVFYKVKPSELRRQNSGKTKIHMMKHHDKYGKESDTVKSWSKAINDLGNLAGYTYRPGRGKCEVKLAEEIVQEILTRLPDRRAEEQEYCSSKLRDRISAKAKKHRDKLYKRVQR